MQSYQGRFEPTRFEDLTVTVDFHCHSACRFCIVQEGLNLFRGVPFERFKKAVDDNGRAPRYRRVTFTGGEVTMEKKLIDYVEYARKHGHFEHIRVQTNGRLMAKPAYAKKLVDAGIDEFFVSLHGHDAALQDWISQRDGSFDEAVEGIRNLKALGVVVMTNTVIIRQNVAHLRDIVALMAPFEPERMEFWNYLPMEDYTDERDLLAPMEQVGPGLQAALGYAKELGIPTLAKYVPLCLLGDHADRLDNAQPDVVVAEGFYDVYPRFSCIWEAKCEDAERCLGLTHPYIRKFGWEKELLVARPRQRPWQEPVDGPIAPTDNPRGEPPKPSIYHGAWRALLGDAPQHAGVQLAGLFLDRRRCTFRLQTPAGSHVDLLLTRRTEDEPALVRSASFDLTYRAVELAQGADAEAERSLLGRAVRICADAVTAADRGELLLDERKGLIGEEAVRRRRHSIAPPV